MELRHLRYFCAVAAHGTFTKAAEILHLTQSALSRQVKDLEDELGVKLFERGANTLALSEAGDIFYEEAREVLARAEQAVRRVRNESTNETLSVGYGPSLTSGILPRAIERFQACSPGVRLELEDLSPKEMSEKAAKGLLDLVILPADSENPINSFQWSELRRMSLVLVASRKHPLAQLAKISPKRLQGLPLIGLGRANYPGYVQRMRAILKPFGVTLNFISLINDGVATLLTALEANNSASILTEGIANLLPPSMVMRPFSPALPEVVINMGLPSVMPNPHALTFSRILVEEASQPVQWGRELPASVLHSATSDRVR